MSEEQNIQKEEPEKPIPKKENVSEHFPEDPGSTGIQQSTDGTVQYLEDTPQPPTINREPETSAMEVHKHPHHVAHKKKWSEYLLEFLMLFLAVFLGFLAEYQLEHVIENQREKKYIESFIEDLKADTAFITKYIDFKTEKREINDSLIWYLSAVNPNQYGQRVYFLARQLTRTFNFFPADRTIKQLKYSGGLRLIRNHQASDSIMAYDQAVERVLLTQSRQESEITEIRPMMGRLMDATILETMIDGEVIHPPSGNPVLRTSDKDFILDFIYSIHQLKTSDIVNASRLQKLKTRATGIMQFLQKQYGLE